jgi:hypothetical protein
MIVFRVIDKAIWAFFRTIDEILWHERYDQVRFLVLALLAVCIGIIAACAILGIAPPW